MAKQTIVTYPAVAKDSKLGTPIADAFKMVNDNFNELYAEPSISLIGNILTLTRPDDTTSTVDLSSYLDEDARAIASGVLNPATGIVTFTRDDASTFTIDLSGLLDTDTIPNDATITLTAGNGLTGGGSFTTDQSAADTITFTVGVDNSTTEISSDQVIVKDLGITTAKLANDAVTHDKLEGRYTAKSPDIATTTGTINLDASLYTAFNLTGALGTVTLNVQNIKKGQVIDILLSGSLASAVVTLEDNFTTSTINKVGTTTLDTASTNIIQVLCVDDNDAGAILSYAIAPYTSFTNTTTV